MWQRIKLNSNNNNKMMIMMRCENMLITKDEMRKENAQEGYSQKCVCEVEEKRKSFSFLLFTE
jgi:hypothetical protein